MSKLDFDFTLKNIEKLALIVSEKNLGEITVEDGDAKITIKAKEEKHPPMPPMGMPPMGVPMGVPMGQPQAAVTPAEEKEAVAEEVSGNVVKSPIVGTFYAAPSPDAKPFVKVGDSVSQGDIIFIIESMKVMSEVQSEFSGTVKKILVNNGDALEFDQPVMIIG